MVTTTRHCHLDFETGSRLILKDVGARLYAEHPSTHIKCAAFCIDDGPTKITGKSEDHGFEDEAANELAEAAADPDVIFVAHNAGFEQAIWQAIMVDIFGWSPISIDRWDCTMARCFRMGLPGKLEQALAALSSPYPKDMDGHRVMQKLAKPRKDGAFYQYQDCPEDFEKLYSYNMQDVRGERWLDTQVMQLEASERRIWLIDQRMNNDGFMLDVPFIRKASALADQYNAELVTEFRQLTGGDFNPSQRKEFERWSKEFAGVVLPNTKAPTVAKLLNRELQPKYRRILEVFQEANKTSLAKYPAMLERVNGDGITRGFIQYYGAHTGRFTGRGFQPQNLTRPNGFLIHTGVRLAMSTNTYETYKLLYGNVSTALSRSIRGVIIARPTKKLYGGDYGQIESKGLAWLAGQEDKLELFRRGEDVYCHIASSMYGHKVTKEEHPEKRQGGKVGDLAFGYQGGIAAGQNFAAVYGVDFSLIADQIIASATAKERELAEYCYMLYMKEEREEYVSREVGFCINILKDRFRAAHPYIVDYWADLEDCAISAVLNPGPSYEPPQGKVMFFMDRQYLHCQLPSGRTICYPFPKVEIGKRGKRTLTYRTVFNGKWIRTGTYGGSLSENITQAICRDIMCHAMVEMEETYPWILSVHDEGISEVGENYGSLEGYKAEMLNLPSWARDIPITVNVWEGTRYGNKD